MSEEEAVFQERARQLEEDEARAAQERKHPNPMAEEGLRRELEKGPSKINSTADPDREAMLKSYHRLKAYHRDLRTGQLLDNIGRRVRLDAIRGPPTTGILIGVDEEYGQALLRGIAKSESSTFVVILKGILRLEVLPEPEK